MTEVWDSKYGKVVDWNGDPQNAPDTCETCDGTGRVYKVLETKLFEVQTKEPILWGEKEFYLSTNDLPDDEECPECRGYGMVY